MSHPTFEIVTTTTGAVSIRNKVVNEIMHNPVGPWAEANSLYIDQSGLRERLSSSVKTETVIFDVGLGAAANALAAIHCAKSCNAKLTVISFEKDLELLKFALEHAGEFTHFAGYETALAQILEAGTWSDHGVSWHLRHGDFLDLIEKETYQPHFVFFDAYSPKVNQEMWTYSCFKKLYSKCRIPEEGGTALYTYSQATRIRAAMMQAGFFVGYGQSTGLKNDTTEAATDRRLLKSPLDWRWYERWQRSQVRYPFDCSPQDEKEVNSLIQRYFVRELAVTGPQKTDIS